MKLDLAQLSEIAVPKFCRRQGFFGIIDAETNETGTLMFDAEAVANTDMAFITTDENPCQKTRCSPPYFSSKDRKAGT